MYEDENKGHLCEMIDEDLENLAGIYRLRVSGWVRMQVLGWIDEKIDLYLVVVGEVRPTQVASVTPQTMAHSEMYDYTL